jgi:UDP-N-acetylmuramate dehydrogenase
MRVGGAVVSPKHANVLVVEHAALASDVMALLQIVRARVLERSGIGLDPEVVFFE